MNFTDRMNSMDLEEFAQKRKEKHDEEMRDLWGRAPGDPCQTCGSKRIAVVTADGKDYSTYIIDDASEEGYLPAGVGIGPGGGEIDFAYCLECGQMQGDFPIPNEVAKKALKTMNPEYDEDEED